MREKGVSECVRGVESGHVRGWLSGVDSSRIKIEVKAIAFLSPSRSRFRAGAGAGWNVFWWGVLGLDGWGGGA